MTWTPPWRWGGCNHKGATEFEAEIDAYIAHEVELGATVGPFECIPFKCPVAILPLSTRPKKDSDTRRVIMDCSWPISFSLNAGISKEWYLGDRVELSYPTTDLLVKRIYKLSRESEEPIYLYKEDLDRAFRQLGADPKSIPLLGFKWRGKYYFDRVMVMGCHMAPYVCQRTTDMIAFLHRQMTYFLLNYMDDFIGVEYLSRVQNAHQALIQLLRDIGAQRSVHKSVAPTQVIEFIGNFFNTIDLTIGVTLARKIDILRELDKWREKTWCSINQIESLVGKLQFMSNCIRPGRLFVSRILTFMRTMT